VSNKTRSMREFTTVVAFDALKNAQFPGTLRGPLMADTVVRDQMVNFVKIEALKPGAMSITILWFCRQRLMDRLRNLSTMIFVKLFFVRVQAP
jgi:hypothetical protein